MSDPIQDSDLAKRNAEERRITLGAISDPENTKMADGRTVSEAVAATYQEHIAEGQAAAEIQLQRTREQSIANDPFYQGELKSPVVSAEMVESAITEGRAVVSKIPTPVRRERPVDVDKPSDESV